MSLNEVFFYDPYSKETDPDFWDCECERGYINSRKTYNYCSQCGAESAFQPDSIVREVERARREGLIYE